MLYLSGKVRKFDLISLILLVGAIFVSFLLIRSYYESQLRYHKSEATFYKEALDRLKKQISVPRYPFATSYERKDYHNYELMETERLRSGPGEHGAKVILTDYDEIAINREQFKTHGLFGVTSDKISVNRSLPDVRLSSCQTKKYLKQLPKVSIVIVFRNELWSVLLRTIHSICNRTPHELLHEVILVNDNSTIAKLYGPLQAYVRRNFNGLVKIHELNDRMGLVRSRLEGAKLARGEVLVFMDSQVEVNVNWLPPLLEPISLTPRLITTPVVDSFAFDTFEYQKLDDGGRGMFNWNLQYRRFPRRPEDSVQLDVPIPSPVMVGAVFAINRQNFFDLGAHDDGLRVWLGEHLEMSLKAHLCGQGMVEVPCSRVAHSYRNKNYYQRFGEDGLDYMIRNYKRISEVWLDGFKEKVYERNRARYAEADVGDLLRAKAIKRGLHCKPFAYFLEFVAPEMLERYPLDDLGYFAQGCIQSKTNPNLCLEVPRGGKRREILVKDCEKNLIKPSAKQFFKLGWHRNLQHFNFDFCLQDTLTMSECHYMGGNQFWKYDLATLQISQPSSNTSRCLTLDMKSYTIRLEICNPASSNQKWNFGEKNISALQDWEGFGVSLIDLDVDY